MTQNEICIITEMHKQKQPKALWKIWHDNNSYFSLMASRSFIHLLLLMQRLKIVRLLKLVYLVSQI